MIRCQRCGRTTDDPDLWDPEAGTGRIFCDRCWDHRNEPITVQLLLDRLAQVPDPNAVLYLYGLDGGRVMLQAEWRDPDIGRASILTATVQADFGLPMIGTDLQ